MTVRRSKHIVATAARSGNFSTSVQDFAERLQRARTLDTSWQTITEGFSALGIEYLIYMFIRPTAPQDNALVRTKLPNYWVDYYRDADLARRDPFLKTCITFAPTRTGPAYLDDHVLSGRLNEEEQTFILEAGETGFTSGFSSPVRLQNSGHFGGWNFGTRMPRPVFEKHLGAYCERLQLMGFFAHEALQRMAHPNDDTQVRKELTERERECMLWLARGLRTAEIADRLNIAAVTVDLHFKRVRTKLAAATREEALAKAILSGEILP